MAMQSLAATSRAQPAQLAGRPAGRAAQAASITARCMAAGAARQRQQGGPSLPPPPPAAAATLRSRRRGTRCQAAAESDIIDVEGKVIDDRVPVTVITGFLGSGKTTLLNNILRREHGRRIAVIENEFGEIDIDSDLVSVEEALDPSKEQIMMLNNGCLCCTVRDDLVDMLNTLYERRDQFDRIVIETTGLAQPAPIIQTFFLEPKVADRMKLDGVVTLVDAKHVELHLDEEKPEGVVNEAMEQIAYADRIILNKTDLVEASDLERLEERIAAINSMAQIRRAQKSEVPIDYVLGVGGFDLEKVEDDVLAEEAHHHSHAHSHSHDHEHEHSHSYSHDHECSGADCSHESHSHSHSHAHSHDHDHSHEHEHEHSHASSSSGSDHECSGAGCSHHSHSHGHSHQHHDDAVSSVSISIEGDMDLDKVNYWLGGLMEVKSNDLYRMKGVLAIKDFPARFVFQGVHMLFEGMPDREWKEGEKRVSKMVFIGKDLDRQLIEEGFRECLVK
ncbi:putative GTP-binding -like isoform A [Chlorella sorokiniana]|uniref:GTP-binding-like isoform A n=1 Tax=Chlorella sorokiniana TaxID=3076 RepID=A0A2P6TER0_CHLSO|nr:putative GTP-binding -like isoform A [Chlorella sorokiniana]|eukprot:PRW21134.1 putative GTP-binding -like isoform A [Chlorella sorokiniana]